MTPMGQRTCTLDHVSKCMVTMLFTRTVEVGCSSANWERIRAGGLQGSCHSIFILKPSSQGTLWRASDRTLLSTASPHKGIFPGSEGGGQKRGLPLGVGQAQARGRLVQGDHGGGGGYDLEEY